MPNHGYYRVSQEGFSTLPQQLKEDLWGALDISSYEKAPEQIDIPVLPLLKMRLLQKSNALLQAISTSSDALTKLDIRWDFPQRKLASRIKEAEDEEDPHLQEAGARLRKALLKGNGTAQTQLSFDEEVKFGKMQVALSRAPKKEGQTTPTIAEDLKTISVEALIEDIERRTQELEAGLAQVPEEARSTSRFARIKLAMSEMIDELNHSHDELIRQIEAATTPDTKDRLSKLLNALQSLIPAPTPAQPTIPAAPSEQKP
jgi:hypothetical protein